MLKEVILLKPFIETSIVMFNDNLSAVVTLVFVVLYVEVTLLNYLKLDCPHLIYKISNEPLLSPLHSTQGFPSGNDTVLANSNLLLGQVRDLHGFHIFFNSCKGAK